MQMFETFKVLRSIEIMGRRWQVSPLRLKDLAQIEAWAIDQQPDPLDEGRQLLRDTEPEKRPRMAARLLDKVEADRPTMGSDAYENALRTPQGILLFTELALRESSVDSDDLLALVGHLITNPLDLERLEAKAYGVNPIQFLLRIIEGPGPDGPKRTWGEIIIDALADHPAWTMDTVGDMTLSQWLCYQSDGKAWDTSSDIPPKPGETREQAAERRRKLFEPDPEETHSDA